MSAVPQNLKHTRQITMGGGLVVRYQNMWVTHRPWDLVTSLDNPPPPPHLQHANKTVECHYITQYNIATGKVAKSASWWGVFGNGEKLSSWREPGNYLPLLCLPRKGLLFRCKLLHFGRLPDTRGPILLLGGGGGGGRNKIKQIQLSQPRGCRTHS